MKKKDILLELSLPVVMAALGIFVPVSYTHLDVYKRQGIHIVPAAGGDGLAAQLGGHVHLAADALSLIHISITLRLMGAQFRFQHL